LLNYVDKYPYTDVKSLPNYSSHLHENLDTTGTSDTKTDATLHLDVKTDVVKTLFVLTEAILVDERVSTVLKPTDTKSDANLHLDVEANEVKTDLCLTEAKVDERVSGLLSRIKSKCDEEYKVDVLTKVDCGILLNSGFMLSWYIFCCKKKESMHKFIFHAIIFKTKKPIFQKTSSSCLLVINQFFI
jgi:hypothetical protein